MATLSTLVSFNEFDGGSPQSSLIADANGNLFGTNVGEGLYGIGGTLFEVANTSAGYASAPTTLVSFPNLSYRGPYEGPNGGVIADANGNLFGATNEDVFEIPQIFGYGSTPTVVANIGANAGLIADANGDLFGTTAYGGNGAGSVFEIAKTPAGYASTPTTLASFAVGGGIVPQSGLIIDADGDLFGTTRGGGAYGDGTVFEIAKTPTGYANSPTTLVNSENALLITSLVADADGDLFGTTTGGGGGTNNDGTVFEIVKTPAGYATTATTLISFDSSDGVDPEAGLIVDANGDLFGTTQAGGANGDGTVFEIVNTPTGYASAPATLVSFDGSDGSGPVASLMADANGDLFGTTSGGGANNYGTVFEITDSGFALPTAYSNILWQNANGQAAIWEMDGTTPINAATVAPNPGANWNAVGLGSFGDGPSDILWEDTDGQAAIWVMNGTTPVEQTTVGAAQGPSWNVTGSGDFNGDGLSDILWQNTDGQVAIWEMNGTSISVATTVGSSPGANWKAVGSGDFNGDGKSDILWEDTDGQVAIWEMNGADPIVQTTVGSPQGPDWKVVGTGDFNGDGKSDILWENTTNGQAAIWEMNGTTPVVQTTVGSPQGPDWKVVGTGDFNGDGFSDILWQNASGQAAIWEMNGTTPILQSSAAPNPGASWRAIGA
jgi:uncharacterized repeat protein (TIGR03803 family)